MKLIVRPLYLEFLRRHRDCQVIRVTSGTHCAGESVSFQLFREELLVSGVLSE